MSKTVLIRGYNSKRVIYFVFLKAVRFFHRVYFLNAQLYIYLNFGYCGFKELNFLNYLLKLQINQQGKTFPQ